MRVARSQERHIGAVREMRVMLDLRSERPPIKIEIRNRNHALRIAYPDQGDVARTIRQLKRKMFRGDRRPAHIHLKQKLAASSSEQAQVFDAGAGAHADVYTGMAGLDQERGRAAGPVAGNLGLAAIGIEQPDGAIVIGAGRHIDQHPAVRPDARVAVADGARQARQIARRCLTDLRQEEVVLGSMGLGEGNCHRG